MIIGPYLKFWGSLSYKIRISFLEDLSYFEVVFRHVITESENIFEVHSLCQCAQLIFKVAQGLDISIYDRRLATWLEEYFKATDTILSIENTEILECLKSTPTDKIKTVVKKFAIAEKAFIETIEIDLENLKIDVEDLFAASPPFQYSQVIPVEKDTEDWLPTAVALDFDASTTIDYTLDDKDHYHSENKFLIAELETGLLRHNTTFVNDKYETISNVAVKETTPKIFRPINSLGKVIDSSGKIVSIFQPSEVRIQGEKVDQVWKVESLPAKSKIVLDYSFLHTALIVLSKEIKTENGQESKVEKTISCHALLPLSEDKFTISCPALSNITRNYPQRVSFVLPYFFDFCEGLQPEQILKFVDKQNYFLIILSDEGIESLFTNKTTLTVKKAQLDSKLRDSSLIVQKFEDDPILVIDDDDDDESSEQEVQVIDEAEETTTSKILDEESSTQLVEEEKVEEKKIDRNDEEIEEEPLFGVFDDSEEEN